MTRGMIVGVVPPNDDAPTEEAILTSGRMAMSYGSARSAADRDPLVRTEGVEGHRRRRRRTRAAVGATQRKRDVPRVERIILQANRVERAQQTAETVSHRQHHSSKLDAVRRITKVFFA